MLPIATDNGARLAAILPSGIAAVARGLGLDPDSALDEAFAHPTALPAAKPASSLPVATAGPVDRSALPALRSFVMIVVDGLGHANLGARAGHAPTISRQQRRRIETVAPSTTAAALTSLTTGRLPGEHGLIGYRIRHPELGLISPLKEWDGIADRAAWQRATPLFPLARKLGARPVVSGRPAHATGGLTEAILGGADYLPGQRIEDRFAAVSTVLRGSDPVVAYLYVDELDKAAHEHGWHSDAWLRRLEQLDSAVEGLLRSLPGDVGVVITADHGIVDVAPHQQIMLDARPELLAGVTEIGGEPRFRSLYLDDSANAESVARAWADAEGDRAWVFTREAGITSGLFGDVAPEVGQRLGDVLIAARKQVAYYSASDSPQSLEMVGQHGSFSEDERGVPLILSGALAGSGFASVVANVAASRLPSMPAT